MAPAPDPHPLDAQGTLDDDDAPVSFSALPIKVVTLESGETADLVYAGGTAYSMFNSSEIPPSVMSALSVAD